jgi:hypothetical protein
MVSAMNAQPSLGTRRRVVLLSLGGLAVAGAGGGAAVALRRWLGNDPAARPGTATRGFDPVRRADFSWLPTGLHLSAWTIEPDRLSLRASSTGGGQFNAELTTYPPGATPATVTQGQPWATAPVKIGAGLTNWQAAGGPTSARVGLRWERVPGTWAQVDYSGTAGEDNLAIARRIAEGVRFDIAERTRLPMVVHNLPAALSLRAVNAFEPGPDDMWMYGQTFATTPKPADGTATYPSVDIRVTPMNVLERTKMSHPEMGPNTTVGSFRARRTTEEAGGEYFERLTVYDVQGLEAVIAVTGESTKRLLGKDGAAGVFRGLDLFANRSEWS